MIKRVKRAVVERLGINRLAASSDRTAAEIGRVDATVSDLVVRVGALDATDLARRESDEILRRVLLGTEWAAVAPLRHEPTISVVLATHNRFHLLTDAVESVVAQTYPRWQLVVVDDGSVDATPTYLRDLDAAEPRALVVTTTGVGAAGARNAGLAEVTGDYVAFLDDDNVMAPGWLRAVAEFTGRHPERDALYGAGLREDHVAGAGDVPRLLFETVVDLDRLRRSNFIDLGVLAARAGHPELRFDESLDRYIDWELVVRLADRAGLTPVPVIASVYTTRADDRISAPGDDERLAAMQERLAAPRTDAHDHPAP